MAAVHVSQAEAARNFADLLAKSKGGDEVFIEEGAVPIAVLHTPASLGRSLTECIAMLPKESDAVIDEDFARDLAEVIELHREPLGSVEWD